ncbi:MAG: ATP-binding protein, partial [Elusimicrobiota bacterium]
EDIFNRNPNELEFRIQAEKTKKEWVFIDEIQKAPKLLDMVHSLIERKKQKFAITGSSARKLRRGASNLLAGRAFVYSLFPLTYKELGRSFSLNEVIHWGSLPKIYQLKSSQEKKGFLRAYALSYLKEEIMVEQLVRSLNPFRNFIEIAAQSNGQILNFSKIANDVGADTKTVQSYFSILEDTLIGFFLPPFHRSVRKQQRSNPKFYLFDLGVKRALEMTMDQNLLPKTYAFGRAFEHFIIVEIFRQNQYLDKDWRLSYLRTKDDAEIDLIIERPGKALILIEIKSSDRICKRDVKSLERLAIDIKGSRALCLSLDPNPKKIGNVLCLPWQQGFVEIGV